MREVNIAIELTCLTFSLTLLGSILVNGAYKKKLTQILLWILEANCLALLSDLVAWTVMSEPRPGLRFLMIFVNLVGFVFSFFQLELSALYIVTYIRQRRPTAGRRFLPAFSWAVGFYILVLIISQHTGWVYYLDADSWFSAGPYYNFSLYYAVGLNMVLIAFIIYYRNTFIGLDLGIIIFFVLSSSLGLMLEMIFPELMLGYMTSSVSTVFLLTTVQYQQELQAVERENELKRSIVLSQIQPHFLYNSLASIEYLCEQAEAEQAALAVREFSKYLRGNMDSLTNKQMIPFAKELEHTRLYLSLERRRFGERLRVHYAIDRMDFSLPPLSLQPIVENAVKYGVTKECDGWDIHWDIQIALKDEDGFFKLTVTDQGAGFDPEEAKQDGRSHVGIENVRHRLEDMCGGALNIHSELGKGTTAEIIIPKGECIS